MTEGFCPQQQVSAPAAYGTFDIPCPTQYSLPMKIIPHGAAGEVTGSCHEIQIAGKRILLDCGLFQGKRIESAQKNVEFTFDPAKDIDALILSHAHMDHVGRIPLLWKRGYRGPVHCTYATKDLSAVMLSDGGYI